MTFREYSDRVISNEAAMEAWETRFDATDAIMHLPAPMRPELARWVMWAIPPGKFLRALISNDFFGAVKAADGSNLKQLDVLGLALLNVVPAACIRENDNGMIDTLTFWQARGGVLGRCQKCANPFDVPGDIETAKCVGTALGDVCFRCAEEIAESKYQAQIADLTDEGDV